MKKFLSVKSFFYKNITPVKLYGKVGKVGKAEKVDKVGIRASDRRTKLGF